MKISDVQTTSKLVKLVEKPAAESCPEGLGPTRGGDRVTLSPKARELIEARQALAAIPDVREDKVAEIKARIADGTYRIDSDQVAKQMIRKALSDKE